MLIRLLTVLLLFTYNLYSQSGVITYEADLNRFIESIDKKKYQGNNLAYLKEVNKAAKYLDLILIYQDSLSSFDLIKSLSFDDSRPMHKLAETFVLKGTYFTNLSSDVQILQNSFEKKDYNVKSKVPNLKWEFINESKEIFGYECKKAQVTKIVPKGEVKIVAWYSIDLPFQFGPTNYGGTLPGLILELEDTLVTYKCKSIRLNPKKEIIIDWPDDVQTISSEEYQNEGDALYKKIKTRGN